MGHGGWPLEQGSNFPSTVGTAARRFAPALQSRVPLHLARHAAPSTDGMFFEGRPHSRAERDRLFPPLPGCAANSPFGSGSAMRVWVWHLVATEGAYPYALGEPGGGMDGCSGNETLPC